MRMDLGGTYLRAAPGVESAREPDRRERPTLLMPTWYKTQATLSTGAKI
jgi:hypothetical protein